MKRLDNNNRDIKYRKAKKRVEEIKSFYKHLMTYLLVNFIFIGRRIYKDINAGDSMVDAFTDVHNYRFFFWWGIGLLVHAIFMFGIPNLFSKDWEEKKINELMHKNK